MGIFARRFVIILIWLTLLAVTAQAAQLHEKDGFTISVPDGWVEIPTDVMASFVQELKRMSPNAPVQNYDYGFQPDSGEFWFDYPYILVQVMNIGRVPESELEKLDGFSTQDVIEAHKKDFGEIMSNVQTGRMVFDRDQKMAWLRMESQIAGIGPIEGLAGMTPTEKGYIQVIGYALKGEYALFEPSFREAAISVTPDSTLAYKPRWSDSLPTAVTGFDWGSVAGKAIIGGLIGGLVALVAGLRKRRKEEGTD